MQISAKPLSRAYDIFVLTLSTNAFVTAFVPAPTTQNSSLFTTLAWILIYFVTFVRTLQNRHQLRAIVLGNLPLMTLVSLCCLSTIWSIQKSSTLHAVFSIVFTTLIAIDFSFRYTQEEFLKTVSYTLIVLIIIGLPFDFLLRVIPDDDFDPSTLHGVYGTKNAYGRIIVLSFITFLCLRKRPKVVTVLYICAVYIVLFPIHSTGALVNCSIMLVVLTASVALRWNRNARQIVLVVLPLIVGAGAYFVLRHFAELTTSVGKDPSLTGRTELWRLAIRSILDRPLLGYGWSAFWNEHAQLAWRIRQQANWLDAPHSHNGYIEMCLGLGFVGFVALLALYITLGRKAYRYAITSQKQIGKWPLIYLIFFIIYQISETTLVGGNSIFWILLVQISLELSREGEREDRKEKLSQHSSRNQYRRIHQPAEISAYN